MTSAGRILIMPKGNYDSSATYEMLDLVFHSGASWVAKKTATGIEPSVANAEYWMLMCSGTDITTLEQRMAALEASFINLANEEDIDLSEYAKQSALDALTVNMQNLGLAVNGLSTELEGVKSTVNVVSGVVNNLPSTFSNVQVLSYVGNDKFGGLENACIVNVEFAPKVLIYLGYTQINNGVQTGAACGDYNRENFILCDALTTNFKSGAGFYSASSGSSGERYCKKSEDGKTITWYNTGSSSAQLNSSGFRYFVLAIG